MNKKQFIDLLLPFKDRLYRIARRMLISKDEAEDAVQEIFLKLWSSKEKISDYRSPEAYAITMMKNHCLDRLKSKQANNLKIEHSNYPTPENIDKTIETNDDVANIFKIIDSLPPKQKLIIQLRDIEHMEFSEIAKILESNETAVRVGLSRARKRIREEMIKKHNYGIK